MTATVYNFSAGPSTLPRAVLEEARDELVDYGDTGMSLIEMSHRGPEYTAVHEEAAARIATVLAVPDDYDVLFLQGGATLQFSMVPMNLLGGGGAAGYVVSGAWAEKALADGRLYGDAYAAWDGAADDYRRMPGPGEVEARPGSRYLHLTSNETIGGIQMWDWPDVDVPLVGDMSSDIMSRPVPWGRFDLVYAGAQKNLGPAGATIVVARRSLLEEQRDHLGAYLRYDTHAAAGSMLNTPPVFAVWLLGKVVGWVAAQGGLTAVERAARDRATVLYGAIEGSGGYYRSPVEERSRSLMNVVFRLPSPDAESEFVAAAAKAGLVGLEGHRSVGGIRASLYNAMPHDGVEALAAFMASFAASRA